jgi:AP2-associated kinase
MAIQNKVQSLLQKENEKPSLRKTAEGYGRFTDVDNSLPQARNFETPLQPPNLSNERFGNVGGGLRKVVSEGQRDNTKLQDFSTSAPPSAVLPNRQSQMPSTIPSQQTVNRLPSRPLAPPKPQSLRPTGTGPGAGQALPVSTPSSDAMVPDPTSPTGGEDWEANFSKRYPSLSGFEMVETEIGRPTRGSEASRGKDGGVTRVREV